MGHIFPGQEHVHIPTKALPVVTVPTLAATGSEMNCGAVITNEETSGTQIGHNVVLLTLNHGLPRTNGEKPIQFQSLSEKTCG